MLNLAKVILKKGLEIADGKYIIFQDGDLEYDPNDF